MSKDKQIYISGPMSGVPREQYQEMFRRAEQSLRDRGYQRIVNPIRVWVCRWPWLYRIVGYRLTLLIVLLALCALLGSCTATKVVTVEKVRTDTLRENRIERDSIWMHDSIHIREKGDTVIIERWHTKWQNHLEHDTVYKSRTDSVPVPYPVIHEVEKKLTTIQQALMAIGGISIMAVVVLIGWRLKRLLP